VEEEEEESGGGCLPEDKIYERNCAPKISVKSVDEEYDIFFLLCYSLQRH